MKPLDAELGSHEFLHKDRQAEGPAADSPDDLEQAAIRVSLGVVRVTCSHMRSIPEFAVESVSAFPVGFRSFAFGMQSIRLQNMLTRYTY